MLIKILLTYIYKKSKTIFAFFVNYVSVFIFYPDNFSQMILIN
ncbi:Uncharacterized protein dnl_63470 [Desulfonema limicola]|uniref:Uncharacterized protein n=1 Tax=Desulfonema limicola TaxID=45656 RepID=A0A975GJV5_9BACT|nr:Uncharacterized protein dnl_63470 [Desulfonema limicola]